jgi:hypothetical protein
MHTSLASSYPDTELSRPRKRQRIDSLNSLDSTSTSLTALSHSLRVTESPLSDMRIPESNNNPNLPSSYDSVAEAGPSCVTLDKAGHSNGLSKENGYIIPVSNGATTNGSPSMGNGIAKHSSPITRVSLPGTTLYDDTYVDREEFVRLVMQSLRDVGYMWVPFPLFLALPLSPFIQRICCYPRSRVWVLVRGI